MSSIMLLRPSSFIQLLTFAQVEVLLLRVPITYPWKVDPESGFAVIAVEHRQLFYHDLPIKRGIIGSASLESSH